jgi:hypothetical protein
MANTVKWCDVVCKDTQKRVGLYTEPNTDGKFRWVIASDPSNPVKSDFVFETAKDALRNAVDSCDWNGFSCPNL